MCTKGICHFGWQQPAGGGGVAGQLYTELRRFHPAAQLCELPLHLTDGRPPSFHLLLHPCLGLLHGRGHVRLQRIQILDQKTQAVRVSHRLQCFDPAVLCQHRPLQRLHFAMKSAFGFHHFVVHVLQGSVDLLPRDGLGPSVQHHVLRGSVPPLSWSLEWQSFFRLRLRHLPSRLRPGRRCFALCLHLFLHLLFCIVCVVLTERRTCACGLELGRRTHVDTAIQDGP